MKTFSVVTRLCPLFLALGLLAGPACNGDQENAASSETAYSPPAEPAAQAEPRKTPESKDTQPAAVEVIPASEAVDTISWQSAANHIDDEVFVQGKITRVGQSKSGHVFLNFDKSDKALTLFIRNESVKNFPEPPQSMYRGKMIKAHGFIYDFDGKPNLSIKEPGDIEILPDNTPLPAASEPSTQPAKQARPDGVIRVATYNLLNLFDGYDDPYTADSASDIKPRAQLEALARSIRKLDADVLAVEEVENRGYLQRFAKAFLPGMGYEVVEFEGNDNRGIDVAILSRLPIGPVTSHRHVTFDDLAGKPMRFRRDLLQVRLEPPGGTAFDVFVVHLKSKGGQAEGGVDTRMGEAREIRKVLDDRIKADPKACFVICGDYNDSIESEPVKTIVGNNGTGLTTFIKDLPENGRVSFNQPPFLSMIDFIFASPAMAEHYVAGSYKIITGGSPETSGSDHNPVMAEFKMK